MAVLFFFTMIHSENSYTKYLFFYQITSSRCSLSSKGSFLPSLHILFLCPKQSVQSPPDTIFLISPVIPASSILLLPAIMVTKFRSRRFLIGLISYHLEQLSYIHLKFCHAARHLSVARSLVFDQIILNAPFVQSYLFVTYLSHHLHRT